MNILPVCMSMHTCVPGDPRGQKRELDHLEQELQIAVSCRVGAEN